MNDLAGIFEEAGVDGFIHAIDLDTGAEVGHQPDELVVPASTFKLFALVELFRRADGGELDLQEQVTVPVADRTPGPTGISVMLDPVTLSWRDLALSMIVVSDNAATDVICDRLGVDRITETMGQLGLAHTRVPYDCRGLFQTMAEDAGVDDLWEFLASPEPALLNRMRGLRPEEMMRTTARDMTRLLRLICEDQAASPDSCEAIRLILGRQVWPHRLASGFPEDRIATGGKTGTLVVWRSEVGFVQGPAERYVVAVYLRTRDVGRKQLRADATIGRAARAAIDKLRTLKA